MSVWKKALPTAVLLIGFGFIYLPVVVLAVFSFHNGRVAVPPFEGPTLRWYSEVLSDPKVGHAALNSILLGVGSSALATVLAFLAAYGLGRYRVAGGEVLKGAILLPMNISYLVIGIGLLILFRNAQLPLGLGAAGLAHVMMTLPLCFAICLTAITPKQVRLEMAARDLGASQFMVLRRVTIGLAWPAIIAAFFLAFTLSWDEFIMTYLLTRFDVTIPITIWSNLRTGLNPETNALGVLVFGFSLALFVLFEIIYFRKTARRTGP
jgi:spermidine/putrescine transport system permease protein